jgi:hypothetical protein
VIIDPCVIRPRHKFTIYNLDISSILKPGLGYLEVDALANQNPGESECENNSQQESMASSI